MATVWGEGGGSVDPIEMVRPDDRLVGKRLLFRGRPGVRVSVYRVFRRGPQAGARERVSQDAYPAMNRVVAVGKEGQRRCFNKYAVKDRAECPLIEPCSGTSAGA